MNRRLYEAITQASETRAFIVLLVVLVMRARNAIPSLRPIQIFIPLTMLQILTFILAASIPHKSIYIFGIGNFIVVWLAILPSMFPSRPRRAHYVNTFR
jgi:hypothetical protein